MEKQKRNRKSGTVRFPVFYVQSSMQNALQYCNEMQLIVYSFAVILYIVLSVKETFKY